MRLALLTLLLLTTACGEPTASNAEDAFYQGTSPDGDAVVLREKPRRIVPANPSTTDLVLALVDPDRIVGLPITANSYSHELAVSEISVNLPTFTRYVAEGILALEPDLVIGHVYQEPGTTRVLRRAGVPVYSLDYPKSAEDVIATVEDLSKLLGERERGDAIALDLRARLELLRADKSRSHLRVLTYTNLGSGVWTTGAGSSPHLFIELAGMQNAGAEGAREMDYLIDFERLLILDPDILIVAGSVSGLTPSLEFLRKDELLNNLKAVRNKHIVVLPSKLFSANSQHLLTAAEILSAAVDALPSTKK